MVPNSRASGILAAHGCSSFPRSRTRRVQRLEGNSEATPPFASAAHVSQVRSAAGGVDPKPAS
jgi:hypothetical protein